MKAKDIFNLIVRLLGLFFVYLAAGQLPVLFARPPGAFVIQALLTAAFYGGVGWWLLGGAPLLVKRAYPEISNEPEIKATF